MGQLFVVEHYDDTGIPGHLDPLPALPSTVVLACAVCVPADDVVLAVVEASDERAVCAALASVGWRIDRITPATMVSPGEDGSPSQRDRD